MPPAPAFAYNDAAFRILFPALANTSVYPAATLSAYFTQAGLYVANTNFGFLAWAGATLPALNLLTAHLAYLGNQIAQGQTNGITIAASIDKISTQMQQAVLKNQWQYWLASSPYGQQLLALLQVQSVGGFSVPGSIGRAGFRA
jgi:Protein of unknown function (DUF4054)